VAQIRGQLDERDQVLRRVAGERDGMGAALFEARKEVDRANAGVDGARRAKEILEGELHVLADELGKARAQLDEATNKTGRLTELNTAFHSGIKMHRQVEGKLRQELDAADGRRREAHAEVAAQRRVAEKLERQSKEMELILQAQRHETLMASQALAKMHTEAKQLGAEKAEVQKRWEDAIAAMGRRDEALQAVLEQKERAREQALVAEHKAAALEREKEAVAASLRDSELAKNALESQVQFLRSSLSAADEKQRDSRGALVEAQVAESLYRQELDRVSRHYKLEKNELERKSLSLSDLKGKLERLKSEFDEKMRNEVTTKLAQQEETVQRRAEQEVAHVRRNEEGRNTELRHENAELKIELHAIKEELRDVQLQKDSVQRLFDDVNSHYVKLYEEAKHWMYDLERKEHDINYMKATIQEMSEVDKARPFQMAVAKLQKELAAAKSENDNIQSMWLDAQKESLKFKREMARLRDDNVFLRTQLGITDTVKIKTAKEIEEAKELTFKQKIENAKLYGELRRLQPMVDEYKQKTLELEQQLLDAKMQVQKENVYGTTASHMLKTEIRRLHSDRREVGRARMVDERSTQVLERKCALAREQADKLRAERAELQRRCFDFRARAEKWERLYCEAQAQVRALADGAGKAVGDLAARLRKNPSLGAEPLPDASASMRSDSASTVNMAAGKPPPLPVWASLSSTPMRSRSLASEPQNSENPGTLAS
ncbi:hypothetical protein HK405_007911, partial [Cladochytrium tenue]